MGHVHSRYFVANLAALRFGWGKMGKALDGILQVLPRLGANCHSGS